MNCWKRSIANNLKYDLLSNKDLKINYEDAVFYM